MDRFRETVERARAAFLDSSGRSRKDGSLPHAPNAMKGWAQPMNDTIRPFSFTAPQQDLDDLRYRLSRTRWPDKENVDGWEQGVPLAMIRRLVDYWRTEYDWRRCEKLINSFPQYVTEIDGVDIHFLHVRSSHEDALPIILTHGWPGSIIEFLKVIGPLVEPEAHGGDPADAFHVVIPSLPGYGFSGKPTKN